MEGKVLNTISGDEFVTYLKESLHNAGDGVIRRLTMNPGKHELTVEFSVESPEGWVNIEITCMKVSEFRIRQKNNTDIQVIYCMDVQKIENQYWLDFDCWSPNDDVEMFRKSDFYISCGDCLVRVLPYMSDSPIDVQLSAKD